jgi:hypothetical protein
VISFHRKKRGEKMPLLIAFGQLLPSMSLPRGLGENANRTQELQKFPLPIFTLRTKAKMMVFNESITTVFEPMVPALKPLTSDEAKAVPTLLTHQVIRPCST